MKKCFTDFRLFISIPSTDFSYEFVRILHTRTIRVFEANMFSFLELFKGKVRLSVKAHNKSNLQDL